ncbi:hypothetical protein G7054_g12582 [Neopestalotiopsis clavispora]|nr:hypothetical protein G7054_g12582 [Neopestalotiopsis clavispora]
MKLFNTIGVSLVALGGRAVAQGFLGNCTWRGANFTGSWLGMYCLDDNLAIFENKWTWHDMNLCVANNNGELYPYAGGNYLGSCRDCGLEATSHLWMNLTCNCFDMGGNLHPSHYDLNQILYNHNGSLGCFDHLGNKSDCGPMCDQGYHPPAYTTPLPSNAKRTAVTSLPTGDFVLLA